MNKFTHLHLHSDSSLLDGATRVPDLISHVKSLGMDSVAITDHGSMACAVRFLDEAKRGGVKPILGLEAYCAPGSRFEKKKILGEHSFHITLLAKDGEGVRNLFRLSSLAFIEGYYYKPRIDHEILERHSKGIICLTGCVSSEFADLLLHGKDKEARELLAWYHKVFKNDMFVELQDNGVEIQRRHLAGALRVADQMGLPTVATSDAHYLKREDSLTHSILLCINTKSRLDDPKRMKFDTDQFYVCSPAEMYARMEGHEEVVKRSAEIADGVEENYTSLGFGKRQFPSFACPGNRPEGDYFEELVWKGARARYGEVGPEVAARIGHELAVVRQAGYPGYFLVVADLCRFATEAGIPVSARGSACGSVLSYVLQISNFCPIKHGLLFERFLDPMRGDPPDIDLDLCKKRRSEVIDYVRAKYGNENVAQIATYGSLNAKSALKDVGRVLGVEYDVLNRLTDLVSDKLGTTLEGTMKGSKDFAFMVGEVPGLKDVYRHALTLEGTARTAGTHAAGVVIAPKPLIDLVPLQKFVAKKKGEEGVVATQWTMNDLEKAGLLKMDLLGLRTMTMLASLKRATGIDDLYSLPLDDQSTFELLRRGETKGVFQLDGDGIKEVIIKIKPDRFDDIVATVALYRPGPKDGGMIDEYVNVKHGRKKAVYLHAVMKEILEYTYGVMIYQEDIMKVLNRLGGIELTRAYACIKAISKKKPAEVDKFRAEFESGAAKNVGKKNAVQIFDLITFFSSYGFNKSHATAYAYIAYQTAYLKAHFPAEFVAALLSSEMDGAERDKYLVEHINDAKRMGIRVVAPCVHDGGLEFEAITQKGAGDELGVFCGGVLSGNGRVEGHQSERITKRNTDGSGNLCVANSPGGGGGGGGAGDHRPVAQPAKAVRYGLGGIKGIVPGVVNLLVAERSRGRFLSLQDLIERVAVDGEQVRAMVHSGALDSFGTRGAMLAAVSPLVKNSNKERKDKTRGQRRLFLGDEEAKPLPDVPDLDDGAKAAAEREVLGTYITYNPLDQYGESFARATKYRIEQIERYQGVVTFGGVVVSYKEKAIKTGVMAHAKFEDSTGVVSAVVWPDRVPVAKLSEGWVGLVTGRVEKRGEEFQLIVDGARRVDQYELSAGVVIYLGRGVAPWQAEALKRVTGLFPGPCDLLFEVVAEGVRATYRAGLMSKVRPCKELTAAVENVLGPGSIRPA